MSDGKTTSFNELQPEKSVAAMISADHGNEIRQKEVQFRNPSIVLRRLSDDNGMSTYDLNDRK
jgi:hypothetical protein